MRRMSKNIPLGRSVPYPEQYSPELLFRVSREEQRKRLEPGGNLPFHGTDIWNAWELTWLDHVSNVHAYLEQFAGSLRLDVDRENRLDRACRTGRHHDVAGRYRDGLIDGKGFVLGTGTRQDDRQRGQRRDPK